MRALKIDPVTAGVVTAMGWLNNLLNRVHYGLPGQTDWTLLDDIARPGVRHRGQLLCY